MTYGKPGKGAKAYQSVGTTTGVMDATPHRLVQMLMEGALDKLAIAKGCFDRGEIQGRGEHISWAISIINGLQASLDEEAGGSIAANLSDLYDYMGRRLLEASTSNSVEPVEEVMSLLVEIKGAWDALPDEAKASRDPKADFRAEAGEG
jgi:flagellar protein FliS